MTSVSTVLLGTGFIWNAAAGVGILFSTIAMLYALLAIGLTTYFKTKAQYDYVNSLFTRSSFPLEIFIMKEALRPDPNSDTK